MKLVHAKLTGTVQLADRTSIDKILVALLAACSSITRFPPLNKDSYEDAPIAKTQLQKLTDIGTFMEKLVDRMHHPSDGGTKSKA